MQIASLSQSYHKPGGRPKEVSNKYRQHQLGQPREIEEGKGHQSMTCFVLLDR